MKVADLFCGAGGLTTGLVAAGLDVVIGLDHSAAAIETYRASHHHNAYKLDLSSVDAAVAALNPYQPNMIVGGLPCEDFSSAGVARREGERADLTYAFARIGIDLDCQYLLIVNVAQATCTKAYDAAMARLRAAGYGLSVFVLDAAFYGVPQRRKRSVLVAKRDANDNWLMPPAPLSDAPMTVREYFGPDLDVEHYYRHPRSYARRAVFSVDEPSATIRGVNRPVPRNLAPHPGDTADIRTVRALTTSERARMQTFPEDYEWRGSKTAVEQMIGNAVPCALAAEIGRAILEHHRSAELIQSTQLGA
ncbi:DNA cytosine methyltransferase [Rhizobium sp. KVB221]|uniref:DNA (cytosine-5-)-methyltransferase n=1 Tax=Rhizobium setariae TaxID=2801340 RepID=A0A936YRF5_9HYPH|nr:DNA cytosine methyltransferase [Rhizobium setariae]MBL0375385.1 DNA cytosine methyltransferase [Rhizobium setariae]